MFLSGCGFLANLEGGSLGGGGSAVSVEGVGVCEGGSAGELVALWRRGKVEITSNVFFGDCRRIVLSFL